MKEFQVIATGATAEFGRTAGGVVNVITKSGTNQTHGSLFHFQRLEGLTGEHVRRQAARRTFTASSSAARSAGRSSKDKAFYFVAVEGITRATSSGRTCRQPIGTPCPVPAPTLAANEALINGSADCQRLALLNFFQTRLRPGRGAAGRRTRSTTAALLGKVDWNARRRATTCRRPTTSTTRSNENQTFDVATYGTSANGTEGPSGKINVLQR